MIQNSWTTALPTLHGPGVHLRELQTDDAPALAHLASVELAWPVSAAVPQTEAASLHFISQLERERSEGLGLAYGVVAGGDDTIVGVVRLRRLDAAFQVGDGSFVFAEEAWDGRLASGSVRVALDFAFRHLGLHRLEIRTMAAREATLVKELGATLEGRLRESWLVGDRLVDQTLWSILDLDWRQAPHPPVRVGLAPVSAGQKADPADDDGAVDDASPLWARTPPAARRAGVTIREIRPEDAAPLLDTFAPEEIQVCIDPPTVTVEDFHRYVAWTRSQRARGRVVAFVIMVDDMSTPAGLVQVRQLERRAAVAEMGILLARQCRGTGVFPVAMRMVLDFTFQTMGVHRLEARTSATNQAGEASLRKLGAIREAHLRASFPRGTLYEDDDLWSILSEDWRRIRRNS